MKFKSVLLLILAASVLTTSVYVVYSALAQIQHGSLMEASLNKIGMCVKPNGDPVEGGGGGPGVKFVSIKPQIELGLL